MWQVCYFVVYLYDETLCISLGAHKPNRVYCPLCYMNVAMAIVVLLHVHVCSICHAIIYYCTLHWYHIAINLIWFDLIWFEVWWCHMYSIHTCTYTSGSLAFQISLFALLIIHTIATIFMQAHLDYRTKCSFCFMTIITTVSLHPYISTTLRCLC